MGRVETSSTFFLCFCSPARPPFHPPAPPFQKPPCRPSPPPGRATSCPPSSASWAPRRRSCFRVSRERGKKERRVCWEPTAPHGDAGRPRREARRARAWGRRARLVACANGGAWFSFFAARDGRGPRHRAGSLRLSAARTPRPRLAAAPSAVARRWQTCARG